MEKRIEKGDVFHSKFYEYVALSDETETEPARCIITVDKEYNSYIDDISYFNFSEFNDFNIKLGPYQPPIKNDTIVESVITKFRDRSETGIKKYGKTLDRDDLNFIDWINHLQEELMDAILYAEKLKQL